MIVRTSKWGWNPAGWQRPAVILLWLGHGVWVLMGPNPGRHWTAVADLVARPSQGLASRWEAWRAARRESARSFVETRAKNAWLAAELAQLETRAAQEAPRLAEADEAVRLMGLKRQIPLDLGPPASSSAPGPRPSGA